MISYRRPSSGSANRSSYVQVPVGLVNAMVCHSLSRFEYSEGHGASPGDRKRVVQPTGSPLHGDLGLDCAMIDGAAEPRQIYEAAPYRGKRRVSTGRCPLEPRGERAPGCVRRRRGRRGVGIVGSGAAGLAAGRPLPGRLRHPRRLPRPAAPGAGPPGGAASDPTGGAGPHRPSLGRSALALDACRARRPSLRRRSRHRRPRLPLPTPRHHGDAHGP